MQFDSYVVLDTNVVIDDPRAIFKFPESLVVIPRVMLEELDKLKNSANRDVRGLSRATSNFLDEISEQNEGEDYMLMENGGFLKVEGNYTRSFQTYEPEKPDNRIMSVAVGYAKEFVGKPVTLYSNDVNVRVMTRALAMELSLQGTLKAKKYMIIDKSLKEIDSGVQEILVPTADIASCRNQGYLPMNLPYINGEHIILKDEANFDHTLLATYDAVLKRVVPIKDYKKGDPIWRIGGGQHKGDNVRPRDTRQAFLVHDILDTDKNLHFVLSRVAGAGKNYITTACALKLLKDDYDRLIIVKPMYEVDGEKTGFLPGTKEEKLAPWFESFEDTMYELTGGYVDQELGAKIEMDVITHMRGRSIPRTIMILDESQNFSPSSIKTLLTRAGEGSKFILMGDLSQIDNPKLDSSNCGLRIWAERARKQEIGYEDSTYILLDSNFRSKLSSWASSFYE